MFPQAALKVKSGGEPAVFSVCSVNRRPGILGSGL
jgi:hypothetical protein